MDTKAQLKVDAGLYLAVNAAPYWRSSLHALRYVFTKDVPVMGVDTGWRCYVNPDAVETMPTAEVENIDFNFERVDEEGAAVRGRARGQVGRLLNGPILLVARDLGDSALISGRITSVLWSVAFIGVVLSIASGLIGSWLATRRVEALAATAHDVMDGNLNSRAPVRGENDEFVQPTVIDGVHGLVRDGDVVIHFNFRADRARQLTHALVDGDEFDAACFERGQRPRDLHVVTMTEYEAGLPVAVVFPPPPTRATTSLGARPSAARSVGRSVTGSARPRA